MTAETNLLSTEDIIIGIFCSVDDVLKDENRHSQAHLHPSELVTIGMLFALKGVSGRAFYRWLTRDWLKLFPRIPERTRLFRLLNTHSDLTEGFLAEPTILGVADTYGIELIHPVREGRSPQQLGRKGISNHRWIVGGKLGFVLNKFGLVCDWDCDTANAADNSFQDPLIAQFDGRMIVLTDTGMHSARGDAPNMKVCKRGTWNVRMVVETVLSMLTVVCRFKKVGHRTWNALITRMAFTMTAFNLLAQWHGMKPDSTGFIPLSIAEFSL